MYIFSNINKIMFYSTCGIKYIEMGCGGEGKKIKKLSGTLLTEKQYQNHTLIFVKLYGIVLLTQKKKSTTEHLTAKQGIKLHSPLLTDL